MKHILYFFLIFPAICFPQRNVVVNNAGLIQYPTNFSAANSIVTNTALASTLANYATTAQLALKADSSALANYATKTYAESFQPKKFSVLVDTSPTIAYLSGTKIDFFSTDSELKVMSGDTMVYWASTLQNANFKAHDKADVNAKIFFQCGEVVGDTSGGRRFWPFISDAFSSVAEQAKVMANFTATQGYPQIGNILICPNVDGTLVDGTAINTIWNTSNAALQPTTLRFNGVTYEQSATGKYQWRIADWTSRSVAMTQSITIWHPQQASDWTVVIPSTPPTFNNDGSVTFSSGSQRIYITQNGADLEANKVYVVEFDVYTETAGAFIAFYSDDSFLQNKNLYVSAGTTQYISKGYFKIIPTAGEWRRARVLISVSAAEKFFIYNGNVENTISIKNFKLYKIQ